MITNLDRIAPQLDIIVDEGKHRRQRPNDGPDGDVSELSDHFRVVACGWALADSNRQECMTYRTQSIREGVAHALPFPLIASLRGSQNSPIFQ